MSHVAEGSLQAYLDGELDSAATTALDRHVASCAACEAELHELRAYHERVHRAFALLDDAAPPMLRAQAVIAARAEQRRDTRRRLLSAGGFGFAKAAMLLIALAGAGAAVIPGSPLRDAIQHAIARVFGTRQLPPAPAAAPEAAATPTVVQNFGFAPVNGRVRISLHAPAGTLLVRVRSTDQALASVETEQATTVSFRSATGRAELRDLVDAVVTVTIPRSAANATIDIDGVVHVARQNGTLQQLRRDDDTRVRFEITD